MTKYISLAALAAAMTLGVSAANASNTATGTLSVTANVMTACTVGTASLDFGNVLTSAAGTTSGTGSINVTCSVPYKVDLGQGQNWSSNSRHLKTGAGGDAEHLMHYTLSDTSSGTSWDSSRSFSSGAVTVYGTLDAPVTGQVAGSYSDAVDITITY